MNMFNPFVINSCICTEESDIECYDKFMDCCAGNIGNSYITYSLSKQLGINIRGAKQIKNINTYDFDNFRDKIGDVSDCTHTLLVLQDQIRPSQSYGYQLNYKKIVELIDYIDRPLLIIGLGANSLNGYDKNFFKRIDSDLISFLRDISERCEEIGIRGEFTKEVLDKIGIRNTCVIGCPSFFETGVNRIVKMNNITESKEILFCSNFYTEGPELDLINNEIVQDKMGERYIKLIGYDTINKFDDEVKRKYINKQYYTFSDIDSWKSFIKRHKLVVGYRLHGTIISLNSGVPAICCSGDSRAREICELFSIPYHPEYRWSTFDKFVAKCSEISFEEMNKEYNRMFNKYCEFVERSVGINKNDIIQNISKTQIKQPRLKLYKGYDKIVKNIGG